MMKRILMMTMIGGLAVVGLSLVATPAFAAICGLGGCGPGCQDSPENPTWILAGIGAVAAGVPWLRARIKRHRKRARHADNAD